MADNPPKKRYLDGLGDKEKARYEEKIGLIGGFDPYDLASNKYLRKSVTNSKSADKTFAPITYIDILNYLVNTKSAYTMDELKAYKSLEAYNQFLSGWVRDVSCDEMSGKILITARVRHSQRMNEKALSPWVIASKSGVIDAAHCDCMAGLGEACTHVGAVLFYVEAAARIDSSKTVTQEKAYWLLPSSVDKVPYSAIRNIDFTSVETKKRQLDSAINGSSAPKRMSMKLPTVPEPTDIEIKTLCKALFLTNTKPSILSVCADYQEHYVPTILKGQLPEPLVNLKEDRFLIMSRTELLAECEHIYSTLNITSEQACHCEYITREQTKSREWFNLRMGRVTASKMKSICSMSVESPAISTVQSVCASGSQIKFSNTATEWGCKHEKDALEAYRRIIQSSHHGFSVSPCGLYINPKFPHVGASPDSNVRCDCCGEGVVEIKCPYSAKNQLLKDVKLDFLDSSGKLKQSHAYSYQIQTQLLVTERAYCDFIVWSDKDIYVQRIEPVRTIWAEIVEKSENIFKNVILPELTGSLISRERQDVARLQSKRRDTLNNATDEEIICVCRKPYNKDTDDVVGCDNDDCQYKWLHFQCVKLKRVPKGSYFCPQCRKDRKKKM